MNKNDTCSLVLIVKNVLHSFYCDRDIEKTLYYLSKRIIWIGPGEKDVRNGYENLKEYFVKGMDYMPHCEIVDEEINIVFQTDRDCLATGSYVIRSNKDSGMLIEGQQRFSMLMQSEDGIFKVLHTHISAPYQNMEGDEYFPITQGTKNYEYMQRLLSEKTEVIDMINSNIMGGLKGSNDDDTFSYFYVNEGLPRMLGYTYKEFMEKTKGTAVGAVYPPDLPRALKMVDESFAKGLTYTAEYRMEKKDGSLIWVIDTGRKAKDSSGEVKINSIITDVTPLKEALAQLELERERYRVALDTITDVLFEYDIKADLFVRLQRVELHATTELDRVELPGFSKNALERGILKNQELCEFMEVLMGKKQDNIEIYTKYIHSNTEWRLSRIRCSVIYDENQNPIKTLGIMKDITDEKEKEIRLIHQADRDGLTKLFNQTATRRNVQEYLEAESEDTLVRGAVLVIDLDRFKPINDKRGHLFGNFILAEFGKILLESVAEDDIAGRIGGDEFLLLLKEKTKEEAEKAADAIIGKLALLAQKEKVETSCSVGITMIREKETDYEQVFRRADEALYLGKKKGGGQWNYSSTAY